MLSYATAADAPAPLPLEAICVANALWYMGRRFPNLAWWEWPHGQEVKAWFEKARARKGWPEDDPPMPTN